MPKTLNIAVIGAGTMAQAVHLPVLRRRWDRFAVTALVDHSQRRRREASEVWGIGEDRRYESVADLIAAVRAKTVDVDAALLATDGLHVEDLLQLLRRGIPVLAEPPLGYSAEEIAKVADFERMTGRRLLMTAYPQQYDDSVQEMAERIAIKDLRMIDHEVLMPASQPLFGWAHVTTSAYDLPSETRKQRRSALQDAVVAGSGKGATQRDRDLYVKGLLTGVAHQMAVLERAYGPIARLTAVRHWPKGVIPGSIEILGELEGGAPVRLVWHYLPFAPEYSEQITVLSARRRMTLDLPAPSHGDRRSTLGLREKKSGAINETVSVATKGSAEAMWEAFHKFVDKGTPPISGAEEARAQVALMREMLAAIVAADDRSLDPEPGPEDTGEGQDAGAEEQVAVEGQDAGTRAQVAGEGAESGAEGEGSGPGAAEQTADGDAGDDDAGEAAEAATDDAETPPDTEDAEVTVVAAADEETAAASGGDRGPAVETDAADDPETAGDVAKDAGEDEEGDVARRPLPADEIDLWQVDPDPAEPDRRD